MKSSESHTVNCNEHGSSIGTVICRHMLEAGNQSVGFIENSSDPEDLQAWCNRCEAMFLAEGDKTEAFVAFNNFAIVCTSCYAAFKTKHSSHG